MDDTAGKTSPGLRVAVLRALMDEVKDELDAARAEAETNFKAQRAAGVKTIEVSLPDGAKVGTVSIKDGTRTVSVDREKLLAHAKRVAPTEVIEKVDPRVLADPELIAWVLENRPDAIREEVQPAYEKRVASDVDDDGNLRDPATGETIALAKVRTVQASGEFSFRPTKDARQRVMDLAGWPARRAGRALRRAALRESAVSPATKRVPLVGARPTRGAPGDDAAAWQERGACRQAPAADWWWPETPQDPYLQRGKQVCATCPVRAQCLAYAEEQRIVHGTWGGVDEWERDRVRRGTTAVPEEPPAEEPAPMPVPAARAAARRRAEQVRRDAARQLLRDLGWSRRAIAAALQGGAA
ncbi:WhiB family transcriptional regulator [Streptomonospora litoralis]|uniref:Transcriptional regulator WhiB n=1 Tax=Streptomonospora litoralis TaxID=2498135 RepID=A0A4P6Q7U6_9ACTN|nr:WhiB family transcriptional regulator [Streptomonospora litoralis]QBI56876.1 Transcriptional regulator WhiB [Streptomonospora litoralis]